MALGPEMTLKEIQFKLGTEQHRLIHLCEKGVIEPDFQQTEGRGRWRRFSKRNLFEFALALELRKYEMPVQFVGVCIRLMRSFEKSVQKLDPKVQIPDSIIKGKFTLRIFDGEYLVFSIGSKVNLGFNLKKLLSGQAKQMKPEKMTKLPTDFSSQLEVNLSEIVKKLA